MTHYVTRSRPAEGLAVVKARIRTSTIDIEYEGALPKAVSMQIYRMLVSGDMSSAGAPKYFDPDDTPLETGEGDAL